MALYAIADLHLSFGTDKPMDDFSGWEGYVQKIRENWCACVQDDDTVAIAGDISWGMNLEQALPDFLFLHALPGTKLLIKGNHDYWWETQAKMESFFENHGLSTLFPVHNSCFALPDGRAVCGTRGWLNDPQSGEDQKILLREVGRLERSVVAARDAGCEPVVFLHYPPIFAGIVCREMVDALHRLNISRCYYGHIHGKAIAQSFNGTYEGIEMRLISGDSLRFIPLLIR